MTVQGLVVGCGAQTAKVERAKVLQKREAKQQ